MMIVNGIAKQAAFYRGYQADERNLVPLTILLAAAVPLWLLVYLVGVAGDAPQAVTSFDSQCCERPEREVTKPSPNQRITPHARPLSPAVDRRRA
jgi:hypothetical protein